MTNINPAFLDKISLYKAESRSLNKNYEFNIFSSMFNWHNEKFLHSNFISMMISTDTRYLDMFLERIVQKDDTGILKKEDFCDDDRFRRIFPNAENHSEKLNIDILIISNDRRKAIIIENKFFASDRIVNENPQLLGYGKKLSKLKSLDGKDIDIDEEDIFYVYMNPMGINPSEEKMFQGKNLIKLSYSEDISKWIRDCEKLEKDEFKKRIISQYGNVVEANLSKPTRTCQLKKLLGEYPEDAYHLFNDKVPENYLVDELPHLKWHILDFLIRSVQKEIEKCDMWEYICKCGDSREYHDKITAISHNENHQSRIIPAHVIFNGYEFYVCYDRKGFTVGLCSNNKDYKTLCSFDIHKTKDPRFFEMMNEEYALSEVHKMITCMKNILKILKT